jgi:oligopeptidase A
MHPFLDESFLIPWSRLVPETITDDITEALGVAQKNIDDLCEEVAAEDLSFENTLLALEEATEKLSHSWGLVSHLDSVRNSDALREQYNAMLPGITQFYSSIPLNEKLWQ